jgi:hypothetical protein
MMEGRNIDNLCFRPSRHLNLSSILDSAMSDPYSFPFISSSSSTSTFKHLASFILKQLSQHEENGKRK